MAIFKGFIDNPNISGIATDFDGTISKITKKRAEATIEPESKQILDKLSDYYPLVAVISGRPVKTISNLSGLNNVFYVGNHGAEYLFNGNLLVSEKAKKYAPLLKNIYEELKHDRLKNFELDYKKYSLAIHYRNQPDPMAAQEKIKKVIKNYIQKGLKLQHGRMVFDISIENIDKGMAVEYLIDKFNLHNFFYAGDDRTDIDAFKKMKELSKNNIYTLSAALMSSESPEELAKTANIRLDSTKELNEVFSKLLPG